jgi:hypothetical protein
VLFITEGDTFGNLSYDKIVRMTQKKILLAGVGIMLVVAGLLMQYSNSPRVISVDEEKVYRDPEGAFILNYPKEFEISGQVKSYTNEWRVDGQTPGLVLAKLSVPKSYGGLNTNFSEAKLVVGWSNDSKAITTCTVSGGNGEGEGDQVIIGRIPFMKFISGGVGAGNFYETTSYRAILDGDCYSLEYTIHSTNIGNYPEEQGVKEFDKSKIVSELEGVVQSFKFLINSD